MSEAVSLANTKFISSAPHISSRGFTLIELIVVIIILGILSVTVVPKFLTSKGFTEFAYRSDVIAKLRLIQTKAMQQTNSTYCHSVLVTSTKLGTPDNCSSTPSFASAWQDSASKLQVDSNDNITFTTNFSGNTFNFDSMGRPSCNAPCIITINGEQSISVQIESEGYIHAL
ncbi:MAG: prepilin-type N-terminal cleavage/methylation domain-containing protein [Colwellia polaris]|jgi:MSHA pilin protein MshC|uniref:prepilin-type N-terminal cleavage/methylation domain-containing protein n=1 Tax=Colwellia polaris TaxID=326537 RepID=UPI000A174ACB|nr:prepilin-type N-terminal cleavage/methylation domain-containing protein [Colwellia polaris]|tara:strand:- start:21961 stop:22476 length:516 start_codon:yes stop_codon:yes gene_type:complete